MDIFTIFCDLEITLIDMTLVFYPSKSQLLPMFLFAQAKILLVFSDRADSTKYSDFFTRPPPPPRMQSRPESGLNEYI